MPIRDVQTAEGRLLGDTRPLTEDELRDLLPLVRSLSNSAREVLRFLRHHSLRRLGQ
jgi:hypothetical protein